MEQIPTAATAPLVRQNIPSNAAVAKATPQMPGGAGNASMWHKVKRMFTGNTGKSGAYPPKDAIAPTGGAGNASMWQNTKRMISGNTGKAAVPKTTPPNNAAARWKSAAQTAPLVNSIVDTAEKLPPTASTVPTAKSENNPGLFGTMKDSFKKIFTREPQPTAPMAPVPPSY